MLTTATVLVCDEGLEELSAYVTNYLPLHRIDGSPWTVGTTLRLSLDATLSAEAYTLDVTSHGITIVGGDYGGVFNGVQTLLQLLPAEVYSGTAALPMALPLCHIEDRPRFAYRGFMLDIVRTWMGPERVKRHIDLISHLKINKLHIPICNDEGWRLEIKSHPELTEIGAWRGGDSPVMAVYGKWNEKYGGYYTQEQMKELIHYAAVRNVEIIPEIDLPGHSRNFARVHPEILCNYTPNLALTAGYDYRSVWCAAREENYMLLADILKEVAALFPSHHIHIGGDEVDMEQWEKCPDCQALRHRKGLVDGHALEQYFLGRLIEQLRALGKEPAVWNEAIKGDALATTTRVHGWENLKACQEAATKGYQTIVMPGAYFYFDMRQTATEDGHDWAGIFDVQKCYDFDFARCGFTEQQLAHVQGVEGAFWSEAYASHSPETPDYLDYMTFPRTCALSEIGWCDGTRQWDDFNKRLHRYYDCMGAQGICFRLMPPTVEYEQGVLTAQSDAQSELTYTVEGGTPIPYTAPITTQCPEYYLFQSHYLSGHSPEQGAAAYYVQQYPEVKITTSMGESKQFPLSRAEEYKGIARTARTCRVDDWIRYDFTDALICRELSIATGNIQLPRFTFTTGYVELSYDGKNFTRCGELEKGAWRVYRPKAAIRAIRVVATCEGNGCPFVTIQSPKIK
jgi:hexosaminidase